MQPTGQTPTPAEVQETDATQTNQTSNDEPKTFDAEYVKELRQEAASYRTRAKEYETLLATQETERKEAERQRLEKQGEFEALYKAETAKALEASQLAEQLKAQTEAQAAVLESLYETQAENVPEHIKTLLAEKPVTERLEWLAENLDEITKTPKANGTPSRAVKRPLLEIKPDEKRKSVVSF